jgi:hypothetical protein
MHDSVLFADTAKLSAVGETDHVPLATAGCEPAAQVVAVGADGSGSGSHPVGTGFSHALP